MINYSRLTDEDEFESLIRDVMALEWGDPHTAKFGRKGQKQYGVDVYGQPVDGNGAYWAAQCKLRKTDKQLKRQEIENEIREAHAFPHQLDVLYLVTDAPRDAKTQIVVDAINNRESLSGRFQVVIWFWDSLCERLAAHPKLLVRYYPDLFRQVTTWTGIERLLDTPIQITMLHPHTNSHYGDFLAAELKMRGVRVHIRHPRTIDDIGIDGAVLSFAGVDEQSFLARTIEFERVLAGENDCPAFVVLPESLHGSFYKALDSSGVDTSRYHLRDPNQFGLADELFQAFFSFGYQRRGKTTTVNVSVRTRDSRPRQALLDLDWCDYLGIDRYPSTAEWRERFEPALNAIRRTLLEQSDGLQIQFDCHLPLPAAFALGYWFNVRVANIGVWNRDREKLSGLDRQLWLSQNRAEVIHFEPKWKVLLETTGTTAVVELTTYVSVETSVQEHLNLLSVQPTAHVQLPLQVNSQSVYPIDETLALAYAQQVGQLFRELNAMGITDTHIFARIPSALAVLVGQRLLACGQLHFYWYQDPGYRYAFSLPASSTLAVPP